MKSSTSSNCRNIRLLAVKLLLDPLAKLPPPPIRSYPFPLLANFDDSPSFAALSRRLRSELLLFRKKGTALDEAGLEPTTAAAELGAPRSKTSTPSPDTLLV
jgi:hypothetical protein